MLCATSSFLAELPTFCIAQFFRILFLHCLLSLLFTIALVCRWAPKLFKLQTIPHKYFVGYKFHKCWISSILVLKIYGSVVFLAPSCRFPILLFGTSNALERSFLQLFLVCQKSMVENCSGVVNFLFSTYSRFFFQNWCFEVGKLDCKNYHRTEKLKTIGTMPIKFIHHLRSSMKRDHRASQPAKVSSMNFFRK